MIKLIVLLRLFFIIYCNFDSDLINSLSCFNTLNTNLLTFGVAFIYYSYC